MKYDLHVHTSCSHDSLASPRLILKVAQKRGLAGIAITDHETMKGALQVKKWNKDRDFEVIPGTEIKTEYGDIIGLFLEKEIEGTCFDSVIEEITSQGGVSILAHPYRHYPHPEKIAGAVDLIEGFNARSSGIHNRMARDLAGTESKGMTGGSDAHTLYVIGWGVTLVEGDAESALRRGETQIAGRESNYYVAHGVSYVCERIKRIVHRESRE